MGANRLARSQGRKGIAAATTPPLNYIEDRVATQETISLEAQDPIRYLVQTKTVLQYKIGVERGGMR